MYELKDNTYFASELAKAIELTWKNDEVEVERVSKASAPEPNSLILLDEGVRNDLSKTELEHLMSLNDILFLTETSLGTHAHQLISPTPRDHFRKLLAEFFVKKLDPSISPSAILSPDLSLPNNISIGDYSKIDADVLLSEDVIIMNQVTLTGEVTVSKNVIIKTGAVIGNSGFGIRKENGGFMPIPHIGKIVLKNHVIIGNHCCIERPLCSTTTIHQNVVIDDTCHIGSGTSIGKNSSIAAGSILGQDVKIGENVMIEPGVKIASNIKIEKNVTVGMGSVVLNNLSEGKTYAGVPAKEI